MCVCNVENNNNNRGGKRTNHTEEMQKNKVYTLNQNNK